MKSVAAYGPKATLAPGDSTIRFFSRQRGNPNTIGANLVPATNLKMVPFLGGILVGIRECNNLFSREAAWVRDQAGPVSVTGPLICSNFPARYLGQCAVRGNTRVVDYHGRCRRYNGRNAARNAICR